jgi:hypothetical protein
MMISKVSTTKSDRRGMKTRVYFFYKECNTAPTDGTNVLEAIANRRIQPQEEYRKLIPALAQEYQSLSNAKFKWSQYAGCSCPCSPGFIADVALGYDIFVDVE